MTLDGTEFLRRFFLHVLPKGFVRIRHFGFLANRFRSSRLALCRQLLPKQLRRACRFCRVRVKFPPTGSVLVAGGPMIVNPQAHFERICPNAVTSILRSGSVSGDTPTCLRHVRAFVCLCSLQRHFPTSIRHQASRQNRALRITEPDLSAFGTFGSSRQTTKAVFSAHRLRPPQTPAASF